MEANKDILECVLVDVDEGCRRSYQLSGVTALG
jgi:hypothetical protein